LHAHDPSQVRRADRRARTVRIPRSRAAPDRSWTRRGWWKEGRRRNDDEGRERGAKIRREVLGDEYVDRTQSTATSLTKEFQDLITRYAWGEIWARPGLDRKTRSCITVAMTVALNRPDQLALHLRGALRNWVTVTALRDVPVQTAGY